MPRAEQVSRLFISYEDPSAGSKAPILRAPRIGPVRAAVGCGQPFCGVVSAEFSSFFLPHCFPIHAFWWLSPGVSGNVAKYLLLERMNSLCDFTALLSGFYYRPQTCFSKRLPNPLPFFAVAAWSQLRYCYPLLFISGSPCCPWGHHRRKALPDCIIWAK